MLNNLELMPASNKERSGWRIDKKTKPAGWDVEWGNQEDSMLLIGVYEYGLGTWDKIIADPKLALADKIQPADGGKPRPEHLQTRAEYLLKNLPKLVSKSPVKQPKKKEKKEKDIREFYDGDEDKKKSKKSSKKSSKSKSKRGKKKKEEEGGGDSQEGPEVEWSDAVFKKCKEMMRPVRKTLRLLENPG